MIKDLSYVVTAKVWVYQGKGAWFFLSLPHEESQQIKFLSSHMKRGWGSVCVKARLGGTVWKTSIFPDSKKGTYILPIKKDVRKKENVSAGDTLTFQLDISL